MGNVCVVCQEELQGMLAFRQLQFHLGLVPAGAMPIPTTENRTTNTGGTVAPSDRLENPTDAPSGEGDR